MINMDPDVTLPYGHDKSLPLNVCHLVVEVSNLIVPHTDSQNPGILNGALCITEAISILIVYVYTILLSKFVVSLPEFQVSASL